MDRVHAMRIFVRVVETGSFTRAADALDLPKATVSQQVSRLESHLGVRLLQRTTRRVQVTEDGAAYYERALALLDDLEDLETSLASARRSPRGRLRIDVPSAFGVHVLAPALPEFVAKYPGIRVEVGSTDRPVDLLGEGVDCVIRGGEVHDESLIGRRLETLPVRTYASPAYLKRHGVPKHPDDLHRHTLIGYFSTKTGRVFPYDFNRDGERVVIEGPFSVAFNDANTVLAATIAGLGIFQFPDGPYLRDALATKRLRRILDGWTADPLVHTILYPSRLHLSARVQVFVDWALERLSFRPD